MKSDVSKRVQSVKDHLDILHKQLNDSLESIKVRTKMDLTSLNNQSEKTLQDSQKFTDTLTDKLQEFEKNKASIEKDVYECQDYIDSLNASAEKFRVIMRQIVFEPSNWMPDEKFLFPGIDKLKVGNH